MSRFLTGTLFGSTPFFARYSETNHEPVEPTRVATVLPTRSFGFLLQQSSILLQTNRIFVALLTICMLGFIFDRLFRMVVDRMLSRYMSYIALT